MNDPETQQSSRDIAISAAEHEDFELKFVEYQDLREEVNNEFGYNPTRCALKLIQRTAYLAPEDELVKRRWQSWLFARII